MTFDTGTFTVDNLQLAVKTVGTAWGSVVGSFTLGGATPNSTATGVLNVNLSFNLADETSAGASSGTFTINGGTANIGTPGTPVNIVDASTTGTRTTKLVLAGGTLNMNGGSIGDSVAPITTVNLLTGGGSATLSNLGGTGITTSTNAACGIADEWRWNSDAERRQQLHRRNHSQFRNVILDRLDY